MDIAQSRRKENIAEYILYLWQLEDMLRALQFSPEAIYSQFVAPRELTEEQKNVLFMWYMDIVALLREEGKEQSGHLDHTLHLIADLHSLHLQLMRLPIGRQYREKVEKLEPYLPTLRTTFGKNVSDTELCFRTLYGVMLYRIKGDSSSVISDTLEFISPVIATLTAIYHQVERGEIDLFKNS
ncbi:MAG: DUF4924 family protein [Alistipes sp.]|jgi:hypothetical protein|nr:DUF4924 family protein [Alistipes sp.]